MAKQSNIYQWLSAAKEVIKDDFNVIQKTVRISEFPEEAYDNIPVMKWCQLQKAWLHYAAKLSAKNINKLSFSFFFKYIKLTQNWLEIVIPLLHHISVIMSTKFQREQPKTEQ